ncbi:MAG: TetR/AcrR family transcriptional regulator [Dehalococcoidia bacterium]|jgi:AcrR family transcriptional regulator|nr:TetR/AcrR family transcriptional regulator [Dehalococcoidia bacterium]
MTEQGDTATGARGRDTTSSSLRSEAPGTDPGTEVRSRKAEQSDRTRATLLAVARSLFAELGYAGTSTEEVVHRAGVTRGALYHHFRDKRELFEAVFVDIQAETRQHIRAASNSRSDRWERFRAGFDEYLNRSMDPATQRITLIDAPAVLGWDRWRELDYTLDMLQNAIAGMQTDGVVSAALPVDELAHLLRGVANEASHMIVSSADAPAERRRVGEVLGVILEGLRTH